MTGCTVTPITVAKGCLGKCKGGGACFNVPQVWVLAACEGMISLFEKDAKGALLQVSAHEKAVFASLDEFQKFIDKAEMAQAFDQIVIVGGGNDIAWIHASLPQSAMRHILAEIEYPLMPGWFKEAGLSQLANALKNVFSG